MWDLFFGSHTVHAKLELWGIFQTLFWSDDDMGAENTLLFELCFLNFLQKQDFKVHIPYSDIFYSISQVWPFQIFCLHIVLVVYASSLTPLFKKINLVKQCGTLARCRYRGDHTHLFWDNDQVHFVCEENKFLSHNRITGWTGPLKNSSRCCFPPLPTLLTENRTCIFKPILGLENTH